MRRVAPRLVETLNRALRLCGETLSYARTGPPEPQPRPVLLAELAAKVRATLNTAGAGAWTVVANHAVDVYRDYGSSVSYGAGKILVVGGSDPPTATA